MASDSIERMRYYQRQFLGAEDFQAEQAYHRDMRRRHNLGHHIWGIVTGLELVEAPNEGDPDGRDVYVRAGLAVDGYGREIVLLAPYKLDTAAFGFATGVNFHEVWIGFRDETARQPKFGYTVCPDNGNGAAGDQARRWLESFEILIAPDPNTAQPEGVVVNGDIVVSLTASATDNEKLAYRLTGVSDDQSVPQQELPADESDDPRWLIKLGSVKWDAPNKRFVPAGDDKLNEGRRYVGAVAETVYAPDGRLVLRHRDKPIISPATAFDPDAQDFAVVEGRAQVDGRIVAKRDVFLHGGKLSFQGSAGPAPNSDEDKIPLWAQRHVVDDNTDLHVHIGDDATADDETTPSAKTRLTVGPKDGTGEKVVLAVRANNHVDVPTGSLNFGAQTRQMLNLWQQSYGIGVQSGTLYYRSGAEFRWYKGGKHAEDLTSADNGTLQMRLDDQARLHFGAQTRQMLNLYQEVYGIGVQDWTLYFRSNADFCWFRDGTHSDNRSSPGAGGTLAMRLNEDGRLQLFGPLETSGNMQVGGNLSVSGSAENVFKVVAFEHAVKNDGRNNAGEWSVSYAGRFSQVYTVFAVLRGFSLWDHSVPQAVERGPGNPINWPVPGGDTHHVESNEAIPQHVFVSVTSFNNSQASGNAYCSESQTSPAAGTATEPDNTVLFTVVVLGRGV